MTNFEFASNLQHLPLASNSQQAADGIQRWLAALAEADTQSFEIATSLVSDSQGQRLLNSVFGNSHYLTECAVRNPVFALKVFADGPQAGFADLMDQMKGLYKTDIQLPELAQALRREKRNAALAIAIGDISGAWDCQKVTQTLTEFADLALRTACTYGLREIHRQGAIRLPNTDHPENDSGLIVLGMGKYGAFELNYSSDIDLIIFYDEMKIKTENTSGLQKYFVRVVRRVLALLNERTGDGYVFRVDLRLRPDPEATQLAMPLEYGLTYYRQRALDWERAAMIKARAVAGDLVAGQRFLDQVQSFIWQKNLDFEAVKEIRTIKQQIDIHKGRTLFRVPGHNVKLGRGGIREIEFFVQAQQLVFGGRISEMRRRGTIDAIDALVSTGQVFESRANDLKEAYHFLRWVEHRLQMINDEQTHIIPEDDAGLQQLAIFLGFDDLEVFSHELMNRMEFVSTIFSDLFEISLVPHGNMEIARTYSHTAEEGEPENLATLTELGFADARIADKTIRKWFLGEMDSTGGQIEALADLLPLLLKVFGSYSRANHTLLEFDKILSSVPADLQFISLLQSHPQIIGMLGNIVGRAPQMVDFLCDHPETLESILIYDFFDPIPDIYELNQEIDIKMGQVSPDSAKPSTCLKWLNERRFQVAVQLLGGLVEPATASHNLGHLTETAVKALVKNLIESEMSIADDEIVILETGDLATGEMTWTSPLNTILLPMMNLDLKKDTVSTLSRCLRSVVASSGDDTIGNRYTDTQIWRQEDIDQKVRGPDAVSELLALSRARVIFGSTDSTAVIEEYLQKVLTRPKHRDGLKKQIGAMLVTIPQHEDKGDIWSTSTFRRNLSNLELSVRYLQLLNVENDVDLVNTNVRNTLEHLRSANFLDADIANDLIFASDLWRAMLGALSIAIGEASDLGYQRSLPEDLQPRLAQIADAPDFDACSELLKDTAQRIDSHIMEVFQ